MKKRIKAPNPNKSQIPAPCWERTHLLRISPHLSWVRAVRPSAHNLAHFWAVCRQISFLPIHRWLIRTNSAALPNPPNRPSLKPPMLPAPHGQTWSLLTKLHPQLFHPDKRLGCPGCSWLISKLLLITAGYTNTGNTLAAGSTTESLRRQKPDHHTNKKQGHWQMNHLERQIICQPLACFTLIMQQLCLVSPDWLLSGQGLDPHFWYPESSNSKHNMEIIEDCGRENASRESTSL